MSGFRVFSLTRRTNAGWLPTAPHGVYMFFVHLLDHGNAMTEDRHSVAGLDLPFLLPLRIPFLAPAHQEVQSSGPPWPHFLPTTGFSAQGFTRYAVQHSLGTPDAAPCHH
jgi:hypothetical protein